MKVYILMGIPICMAAVLAFLDFYTRASCSQKDPKLGAIVVKSVMFAGACFGGLVLFIISQIVCGHFHMGFWIPFMISVLISLVFLGFCHRYLR
jgi:hypothetical protein